jgi:2,4-dienoyl-CoA reductase [(3E)-enoyl-CoA-producing], peroxisomal
VRKPETLKDAVAKTIEKFGRIDFVICGTPLLLLITHSRFDISVAWFRFTYIGAAGNFLAPISGLSENAFRTVMEIDTV